ncbi:MAG: sigma 54-interacting transcriptional regulator [Acidobacteriota bacterium]|nr:sigma 54-interacting transcriptional regulator [Acidobacteriota bacterium]
MRTPARDLVCATGDSGEDAPLEGRIACSLLQPADGDGVLDEAGRVGVSIGASRFVGSRGPIDVPPAVRRSARVTLTSGEPRTVRHEGGAWIVTAVRRPFPALIAVRGTGRAALHVLDRATARISASILPALALEDPFLPVVACSPGLSPLIRSLRRIAPAPLPVLIVGETGTGKDVLARAVHAASGRGGPFVAENCAALPEALLEAELFGVRRGAFTGADRDRVGRLVEADRGTLFLDEIGDLPTPLQAKLLRVLQEHEIRPLGGRRAIPCDLRVVSATHRSLPQRIDSGSFRVDLYFRLAGFVCEILPLRERRADLPYLAAALLARLTDEGIGPGRHLDSDATCRLSILDFKGNVRELDNLLRRSAALSGAPTITAASLAGCDANRHPPRNLEWTMIRDALRLSGGVKAEAARRLGWSRQKLYRRISALGGADRDALRPQA